MNYIVTGGAGFIGSHLCDALIQKGDRVVCVDNRSTGQIENVERLMKHERFVFLNLNVSEMVASGNNQYHCLMVGQKLDGIFHLASPTAPNDVQRLQDETIAVNDAATERLIRFAKANGAKFLFASSVKVHGDCPRVQPYIKGKRAGEKVCLENNVKVARLASVYGPRMRVDDSRVIPVFINKALRNETLSLWNGGAQLDSFCYVTDIVNALIRFMESEHYGVIEFGSPTAISIMELARVVLSQNGSTSGIMTSENILVVDECHKVPDISVAQNYLRWKPEISLQEGIAKTTEYYKEKMK